MRGEIRPLPTARPHFRIWIRRTVEPETTFSIQFTLVGARGLLAVARPGGTMESPAAIQGIETMLTSEEIRGTRFVVSTAPDHLEEYLMVALGEGLLERLPEGYWVPLVPRTAGTIRLLLPRIPSGDAQQGDASGAAHTQPISRPDVRRALRDALARAAGHSWARAAPAEDQDALATLSPDGHPVIVEHQGGTGGSLMEVEEDVVVYLGEETEEEAREGPAGRFSPPEVETTDPIIERPRIPADLPPPPAEASGFGARLSSLVRFLRREQERDRAEISRLRARVAELEADQALSATGGGSAPRRGPDR